MLEVLPAPNGLVRQDSWYWWASSCHSYCIHCVPGSQNSGFKRSTRAGEHSPPGAPRLLAEWYALLVYSAIRVKDILSHLFWLWLGLVCANINVGFALSQPASSCGKRPFVWITWQAFLLVGLEKATFLELDPELARVTAATQFLGSAEAAATPFH